VKFFASEIRRESQENKQAAGKLFGKPIRRIKMATNVDRMNMAEQSDWGLTLENAGANIIRYGLVVILLWVGLLKFTAYEAEGIQGLIANSPLMSWHG